MSPARGGPVTRMKALLTAVRARAASSHVARRLAVGAAWSMAGAVIERVLSLAGSVVIVRILGKESFGQLAILQSTLTMVGVFAGLGLGLTATKYVASLRNRDPQRLARVLTFANRVALASGALMAGALAAGSGFIATHVLNMPEDAGLLAVTALALLFNTHQSYQSGALIGFEAMRKNTLAGIGAALISIPLSVSLAFLYGLAGAVWGLVLGSVGRWLISRSMLADCMRQRGIPRSASGWTGEWRAMRDFALPALLSSAMVTPAHWICHAMLVNTPGGKEQMAVLGIANQWYYGLLLLPMAAARIVLPVLTDSMAGSRPGHGASVLRIGMLSNCVMVLPFALALGLCSPLVMRLYGPVYGGDWPVLAISVATATLVAIQAPVGSVVAASGRMWLGTAMNLAWATVYVAMSRLLLERGAMGVALALLSAYVFHSLWTFAFAARQMSSGRAPKMR